MYFCAATQLTVVDIKELGISFSRYLGFHSVSHFIGYGSYKAANTLTQNLACWKMQRNAEKNVDLGLTTNLIVIRWEKQILPICPLS